MRHAVTLRRWIPLLSIATASSACAGAVAPRQAADPALVVMISVDQLRADLVTRYDQFYTGGFRRLIDQGAHFDAVHDHGISETAPGHATLSTGTIPARNGIVANEWLQRSGDAWVDMYTVGDPASPIIGFPDMEGMSPRNLLRSGLAEWVVEKNPEAKVASIAGKDRSAVLMAAHTPGAVYWYDTGRRRFVTSTYYRTEDLPWVSRFNDEVLPTLLDSVWLSTAPAAAKALARPDTAAYEADGVNTFFPYRFSEGSGNQESFSTFIERTPYPDLAVTELAKLAVREMGLGEDRATDFLAVGLSQADRIGHRFGPLSREQLENLLHVDRVLGDLFEFLDEEVGEGRWVAALSADHGALTMPEWLVAHGEPGARLTRENRQEMNAVIAAARASAPQGGEAAAVARALSDLPFLAGGYTRQEIAEGTPRDSIVRLLRNSYHPDRMKSELARGGVIAIGLPGTYMSTATTGSGHGTPYYYDRSVPLIFLGAGVQPGRHTELARTVDLAPTLARLADVAAPNDLDGVALELQGR